MFCAITRVPFFRSELAGAFDQAAENVRRLWPDFEQEIYDGHLEKWMFAQPDLIRHIVEGLEKAGLSVRRPDQ